MTGTIAQLQRDHGTGVVLAEDGKTYLFRRTSLKDCWFHELRDGTVVTFEPGKDLSAHHVCPIRERTGSP
jgi:cold shock CspA family protein